MEEKEAAIESRVKGGSEIMEGSVWWCDHLEDLPCKWIGCCWCRCCVAISDCFAIRTHGEGKSGRVRPKTRATICIGCGETSASQRKWWEAAKVSVRLTHTERQSFPILNASPDKQKSCTWLGPVKWQLQFHFHSHCALFSPNDDSLVHCFVLIWSVEMLTRRKCSAFHCC